MLTFDTNIYTRQLNASQTLSQTLYLSLSLKIFNSSYSNSVILRDAYIIIITGAVSPNNGILCKVFGSTADNLKKVENRTIIVYRELYFLIIIYNIPFTLPGMPFVQFQGVQT